MEADGTDARRRAARQAHQTWLEKHMTDDTAITAIDDQMLDIVHDYDDADTPIIDLVGADVSRKVNALSIPLLGLIETKTRTVRYRQAEGLKAPGGQLPRGSRWMVADPRVTLRRAIELFRDDLLYFHSTDHSTRFEFLILPVRESRHQSVRLLVRKPVDRATG
jgi:hypothetical protein